MHVQENLLPGLPLEVVRQLDTAPFCIQFEARRTY